MVAILLPASPAQVQAPDATRPMDIAAEFRTTVSSDKIKPGDQVRLEVHAATLWSGGVVIPEGAKLTGRVTEAIGASLDAPARLGIAIERAEWKDKAVDMNAHIIGRVRRRMIRSFADPRCRLLRRRMVECVPMTTIQEDIFYRISDTIGIETGNRGTVLTSARGNIVIHKGALLLFRHFEP